MCSSTITNISTLIALSLSKLTGLNAINNDNAEPSCAELSTADASSEIFKVFLYVVDLIILPNKNEKDKVAVKNVVQVSLPILKSAINRLGDKMVRFKRMDSNSVEDYNKAIAILNQLQWYDVKTDMIVISGLLFE